MEIRLNRFIAQSGCCSRRKADQLIKEGKVKVDGRVVTDPWLKVDPDRDTVEVEGRPVKPAGRKVYIKLYKPRGYLTALGRDRFGRKTLTDLFEEIGLKESVFPAGRLDYDSEGLLILTNDGSFANMLIHPRHQVEKVYHLKVSGHPDIKKLQQGTHLEDGFFRPDRVRILSKGKGFAWVEVAIHSGKKRILRRFFKALGHTVLRLIRVKIGNIHTGSLKPGQYSYIPASQIDKLINTVKEDEERNRS